VTFGGTTRQYRPTSSQKLLDYHVTLPQVLSAVGASNANVGGNYLSLGTRA